MDENASKNEQEKIINIELTKLENFPNHPFKVVDWKLGELQLSISENGITTPFIVREKENGNYEMISGHRRKRVCELLGIESVPCIIRNLNDYEAVIQMVDSNIQREEISFSEKAFAYKMRLEAMKKQGTRSDLTFSQIGKKLNSYEDIGKELGESRNQIHRYIRLTELIPPILEMVDSRSIAFSPAVEISYLTKDEQRYLYDLMQDLQATPSLSQAQKMKKMSQNGILNEEKMEEILDEKKGNQISKYEIIYERFSSYLPREIVTAKEVENYLLKCAIYCKKSGIEINKLNIDLPKNGGEKVKNKSRDAR